MDNAQKAIMIGVGLFLTILVISVVVLITNLGIGTTRNSGDRIVSINKSLETQLITQYGDHDMLVTANDVAFAINQYMKSLDNRIYVTAIDNSCIYSVGPNLLLGESGIVQVAPNTKAGLISKLDFSKNYYANFLTMEEYGDVYVLSFIME